MWHSHHNESKDEDAWILPVQDAGLSLHQVKYLFFSQFFTFEKNNFFVF